MSFDLLLEVYAESAVNLKQVICYPGRFQPFHVGHASVYRYLANNHHTADVFVVTTDKVDPPRSPFNFDEKRTLMNAAGIPAAAVVQVKNPYAALEVIDNYNKENLELIFAISEKDMADNPRFGFKPKKDGSPSYLQPYKPGESKPASEHAYIITIPTLDFSILGGDVRSASQIRALYADGDEKLRKQIVTELYGGFKQEIYDLFNEKLV